MWQKGHTDCLAAFATSMVRCASQDSLAEWSKALASGASPQGRGFEPHSCHSLRSAGECTEEARALRFRKEMLHKSVGVVAK